MRAKDEARTGTVAGDPCLGCSACTLACPVTAADGGFAGPKALGPALARHRGGGWPGQPALGPEEARALGGELCLQCHQCDLACPSGLAVSTFTREARLLAVRRPSGRFQRFAADLLTDQERFGRLAARVAGVRRSARAVSPRFAAAVERAGLEMLGLSGSRSLPSPPRINLRAWLRATGRPEAERGVPAVLLFAGCHARFHDPKVGQATAAVLRASGYRVVLPGQVCCGSPALSASDERTVVRAAEANLGLLAHVSDRLGGGIPVISPCPSCSLALRELLPQLVPGDAARDLARQVWDLGEFLAGPAREGLSRALDGRSGSAAAWAYHMPCHLKALGVGRVFPGLLAEAGLGSETDAGPASDACCGMGGLYGLTREGYQPSLKIGAPTLKAYGSAARASSKVAQPAASSPPAAPLTVLSDCPACRWQISDATELVTAHPVELLAGVLRSHRPS